MARKAWIVFYGFAFLICGSLAALCLYKVVHDFSIKGVVVAVLNGLFAWSALSLMLGKIREASSVPDAGAEDAER
jgi:hypothetical protein